jgi:hypothetical protein
MNQLAERTARAKREVLADVAEGFVPAAVKTFSELHNYVDANCYGGACEVDAPDVDDEIWNTLQDAIDVWIRSGKMERESRSKS